MMRALLAAPPPAAISFSPFICPSSPCEIGVSQFQSSTEMGGLHSSGLAMKLGAFITDPALCGDEFLGPSWSTWRIIARLYDSDAALLSRCKAW